MKSQIAERRHMFRSAVCLTAVILPFGNWMVAGDTQRDDLSMFQGVWTATSGTSNGEPVGGGDLEQTILIFRGNKIQVGSDKQGTFELNDSTSPGQIDITVGSKTQAGLYEIGPHQLRLCLSRPNGKRPRQFSAPPASDLVLLTFEKASDSVGAAPRHRPQEPQEPFPYDALEISYEDERTGIHFAGTLTRPRGAGPFPAALLVTGSGQQDRDETHKGHKPFLVLADYLTRRGVAVLRVDDREVGGTTGNAADATSEDFAHDVLAGIAFLKQRKEIDVRQIGLIGHSEGGLIAPLAAAKSSDVAFVVMMAGPGLPGDQVLYFQDALLSSRNGARQDTIDSYRRFQERMFAVLKTELDNDAAEAEIRAIAAEEMAGVSEEEKRKLATQTIVVDGRYSRTYRGELSNWFRFFLKHDPRNTLKRVKCPVLSIVGENDLFVPPQPHLAAIESALKSGGNSDFLVKELPGLNHMFQSAATEAAEKYAETIAPLALNTIGDWIVHQTAAFAAANSPAAADLVDKLNAYVQRVQSDWQVPGLAIGVVKGDLTWTRGYGVRQLGQSDRVDADTLFQIGSTTKAMTAATVGILVDDGKLDWDDQVILHLPAFLLKDPFVTRELRVRDLLTHRAGLPNTDYLWNPVARSRSEMIHLLRYVDPIYSLRSGFVYQNVMYVTAGELVAVASNATWEEFLSRRLLEPLGMARTVINLAQAREQGNFAVDHRLRDGDVQVMTDRFEAADEALAPAGTVWSSANDMTRWMRMLLNRGMAEERQILSEQIVDELLRPQTLIHDEIYPSLRLIRPHWTTYSLGWFQIDYRGRAVSFHTGSYAGMAAIVGLIPAESLGVVVLTNLDHAEVRHALMLKVFDLFGSDGYSRDWSADLKKLYSQLAVDAGRELRRLEEQRVSGTRPSLPFSRFAGRYTNRLYGDIEILDRGEKLVICWGSTLRSELQHWHYDVFRVRWPSQDSYTLFSFVLDASGEITHVRQEGGPSWMRTDTPSAAR